ncbi:hypothetical protein ACFU93_35415 [Streptomyces sp. NPDC057611]|uniref:hypothetical protein n=1 Tax=Streptomyces sp. NPDC057611 TaxID=3346182 RepID=UPI0036777E9B
MNWFGTSAVGLFIGVLFTGYVLIFRPPVHLTVSKEVVYSLGGVLSGAVLNVFRLRHYRR